MLFTKEWWSAMGVRVLKTFAQAIVGMIPVAATIAEVDWLTILYTAALAAVLAFFTAFAGLPEVNGESYPLWRVLLTRALKTVAQTALGAIPAAATIVTVDWKAVLSAALVAGFVSILMTLANFAVPEKEGAENE